MTRSFVSKYKLLFKNNNLLLWISRQCWFSISYFGFAFRLQFFLSKKTLTNLCPEKGMFKKFWFWNTDKMLTKSWQNQVFLSLVSNLKKISKWTGLFSVNGLGLHFCGIFEEKKLSFGLGGKKKGREKISEISVTFDNLEKMSKFF